MSNKDEPSKNISGLPKWQRRAKLEDYSNNNGEANMKIQEEKKTSQEIIEIHV
jgi:hypothetical protein